VSLADRPRHRFALSPDQVSDQGVRFPPALAHQIRRVLRLRTGERVRVFDGTGVEHTVRLEVLSDREALGTIESSEWPRTEARLRVTLVQALLPRERFELALQKGTEVGVARIVPLVTERTIPAATLGEGRLERWRRIVVEAAEQSGRVLVPELADPQTLGEALRGTNDQPCLLAWERERDRSIHRALSELAPAQPLRLTLVIGPEGGFSAAEVAMALQAGATAVSLGPRTLRAETAGPLLVALALYVFGDLEPPT
jgi:16S rRNA (uracil1498-N3)-methyltransferase